MHDLPENSFSISQAFSLLRPKHWIKNGFVLVPILFAGKYHNLQAWINISFAFAAFCAIASAIYIFNDICDKDKDAKHPVKCKRAIASGCISTKAGIAISSILLAISAGFAWLAVGHSLCKDFANFAGWGLFFWLAVYLLMQIAYSLKIKNIAILDMIFLSLGFVVRAVAGAAAISVPVSGWLILCSFMLCLYLAAVKRRSELAQVDSLTASETRPVLRAYENSAELDRILTCSAGLSIMTYSLYCLAPRTIAQFGSANMVWTIPLVVYGIFRYDRVSRNSSKSDLVQIILSDKILWLVVACYIGLILLIIRFGAHPAIKNIISI